MPPEGPKSPAAVRLARAYQLGWRLGYVSAIREVGELTRRALAELGPSPTHEQHLASMKRFQLALEEHKRLTARFNVETVALQAVRDDVDGGKPS